MLVMLILAATRAVNAMITDQTHMPITPFMTASLFSS